MDKRIIDKANIVFEVKPIAEAYYLLQGHRGLRVEEEVLTIADTLSLTTIIIRLVDNEIMREYERRYDELYGDDETLVTELLELVVEIFDMVIYLHEQNNLILWQPGKGAVLVNGK